jgi:hypothetical protein
MSAPKYATQKKRALFCDKKRGPSGQLFVHVDHQYNGLVYAFQNEKL